MPPERSNPDRTSGDRCVAMGNQRNAAGLAPATVASTSRKRAQSASIAAVSASPVAGGGRRSSSTSGAASSDAIIIRWKSLR